MTEWGVVGVIIALAGFLAVVVKPLIALNTSITRLTAKMDGLGDDIDALTTKNTKSHDRMWQHNDKQDGALKDHEGRIVRLEVGKENKPR